MFSTIKTILNSRKYNLQDMLQRIKILFASGDLTREEYGELIVLANQNVSVDGQTAALADQVAALLGMVDDLQQRVTALEQERQPAGDDPGEEPAPAEAYPIWAPWNGIPPVPYNAGSIVTHNGKTWESVVDNNVWEPGAPGVYDTIWRAYVPPEEATEE